jgi:hypothetical protein
MLHVLGWILALWIGVIFVGRFLEQRSGSLKDLLKPPDDKDEK